MFNDSEFLRLMVLTEGLCSTFDKGAASNYILIFEHLENFKFVPPIFLVCLSNILTHLVTR
jgi:hypothetical protein